MYKNLSPEHLQDFMREHQAVLIDVRSPVEYAEESIPGSVNIPLNELLGRLTDIPKDRPIVLNCRSGGRSAVASLQLIQRGYTDIYNLEGGLLQWNEVVNR